MIQTVYVQAKQLTKLTKSEVQLSDVANVWCADSHVLARCNAIRLGCSKEGKPNRMIFSMVEVIQKLQEEIPNLIVETLGEVDFVVEYVPNADTPRWLEWVKTGCICLITFSGAAFAIMTFDCDVDVHGVFQIIYQLVLGHSVERMYLLEWTYCIGLGLGILIFYNHFSKKKSHSDPTPLEVEMRTYEQNILTTEILNYERQQDKKNRKKQT